MTTPLKLDDAQRRTLGLILDILIPSALGMPSAREADVHTRWIDEALRLRPDLGDDLVVALESLNGIEADSLREMLRAFASSHPGEFASLGTLIAGAYYMDDRARAALGYPGQESRSLRDETDSYVDMLERVVERGEIYRQASH